MHGRADLMPHDITAPAWASQSPGRPQTLLRKGMQCVSRLGQCSQFACCTLCCMSRACHR